MDYKNIIFEVKDHVAFITLNRPDAANGINIPMARELMSAAIRCDDDPDIRAVLLTGAGKIFSAGGDLKGFVAYGDALSSALKELTVYAHAATSRFLRMGPPVITVVNGTAAGMGMSFAICGDLTIAAESAMFVAAYAAAGLSPDGGMTYLLPRMIGMARAKEMLLTNRRLTARKAFEWGLVNKVVPAENVISEAEEIAKTLANGPTCSFGSIKKLLNASFSETLETQLEQESLGIVGMTKTRDGKEGMKAFVEKRRPAFKGL